MPPVPNFSLYGERARPVLDDWIHCESIPVRSRLHHWEIGQHRHSSFFQILYLARGSGECRLEGRVTALLPASAVTVPPSAVHGFHFSEDVDGWVLTLAGDRADAAAEAAEPAGAFRHARVIPLADNATGRAAGACLEIIAAEMADGRRGRDAVIEAQLRSLFVLLGRNLADAATSQGPNPALHGRSEAFRDLVNRHFRTEKTLGFYAGQLGVSETHLNRICRSGMGQTALSVIHERILAEAARDLAFTTLSVAEIGRALGFDDPGYFSRFFRKGVGEPPKAYRHRIAGPIPMAG